MYIRTSVPGSLNKNRQKKTNIFIEKNKPQFILRTTNKKKVTDLGKEKKVHEDLKAPNVK